MDFIERIFGLNPDQGSGMTEAAILAALMAIVALVVVRRSRRRRSD